MIFTINKIKNNNKMFIQKQNQFNIINNSNSINNKCQKMNILNNKMLYKHKFKNKI